MSGSSISFPELLLFIFYKAPKKTKKIKKIRIRKIKKREVTVTHFTSHIELIYANVIHTKAGTIASVLMLAESGQSNTNNTVSKTYVHIHR